MSMVPDELRVGPLVLQRWREAHLEPLMAAIEASIEQLRPWMPWAVGVTSEAEREFLRRSVQSFDEGTEFGFGVFDQASATVVGGCGMHGRHGHGVMELGYWTHSGHSGRGYATLAAGALTTAAFELLPHVEHTVIHCDVANRASARVAQKLGYRHVGDIGRQIVAPGQTGRGMVWVLTRSDYWMFRGRGSAG